MCTPRPEIAGVRDVTLSRPHLVGGSGILDAFVPALGTEELAGLQRSAGLIREAIGGLAPA